MGWAIEQLGSCRADLEFFSKFLPPPPLFSLLPSFFFFTLESHDSNDSIDFEIGEEKERSTRFEAPRAHR